ncbi:type III secretion system chaperone family protein [Glycomyces albidus]|uniref:DUF3137 domain-containing protein n=1 Tax=Glycomyces albidus TaxID=2656774 RepID=A0A6L5G5P9_9ACTN|nr:hypothetical protein [Glycomyces albidus]MQM24963.1 hypothetical protein [Glycomyces albidus]
MDGAAAAFLVLAPLTCLALIGTAIGLAVYFSRRSRNARIARCQAWAAHHGFQYRPADDSVLRISARPPFTAGHGRSGVDVFRGVHRGVHLHCFEYRYRTSDGENETTHYFQVVAVGLPAMRPYLEIGREGLLPKSLGKDIDFENHAFNERFRVVSANPRFAHDVIHPRTMEWMLADPRAQSYRWRFEGSWLMTFRKGRLNLDELLPVADFLCDVLAQIPKHVWADR